MSAPPTAPNTLVAKVWDDHVVRAGEGDPDLLYIDLHLVREVTSPQAFEGRRPAGRPVRRPDLTLQHTGAIAAFDAPRPSHLPVVR